MPKAIRYALPSIVTLTRLAAAPLLYHVFLHSSCILAIGVFTLAALTDMLDGAIARRLDVASDAGGYLDATVDFILIVVVLCAFMRRDWYSAWVLVPVGIGFLGFVLSSGLRRPVYDPVGKYTGTCLMAVIVLSLLLPYPVVREALAALLLGFCLVSVGFRVRYLARIPQHE